MGFLPGWDSADTTAAIAHNLHITAIVVLGLLVVSEGLALMYDSRKEHLASIAALNAETQRKRDADDAEVRRKADVGELQKRLKEAGEKVKSLEAHQSDRTITPEQKDRLIVALKPFKGQQFSLIANSGEESTQLAEQFLQIFLDIGIA